MVATIAAVIVGATFVVSGVAKLARPLVWRAQAAALGAPARPASVLPVVEVVLGAVLIVQWQRTATAIVAALILAGFTGLLGLRIRQGRRPPCACFGSLSTAPIGWRHLLRNTALFSLAVVAAFA